MNRLNQDPPDDRTDPTGPDDPDSPEFTEEMAEAILSAMHPLAKVRVIHTHIMRYRPQFELLSKLDPGFTAYAVTGLAGDLISKLPEAEWQKVISMLTRSDDTPSEISRHTLNAMRSLREGFKVIAAEIAKEETP